MFTLKIGQNSYFILMRLIFGLGSVFLVVKLKYQISYI
jgi:hypothetical protein